MLAALIDPGLHSCGAVRPHGLKELGHPVRSVVAEAAGDHAAVRIVQVVVPETGVCPITASSKGLAPAER